MAVLLFRSLAVALALACVQCEKATATVAVAFSHSHRHHIAAVKCETTDEGQCWELAAGINDKPR